MNDVEKEVLILNNVLDATADLMSRSLISPYENAKKIVTEVKPKNYLGKRLFSIILLELISPLDTSLFKGKQKTALEFLIEIGQTPKVGGKGKGKGIAGAATNFQKWLEKEFDYDFDSAVGKRIKVKFTRKEVINFCGNYQKHFGYRLGAVVRKMTEIYAKAGTLTSGFESLKLLEDVQSWLYDDVFGYHFTKICEHVSEVNNAIEEYLLPVYDKMFKDIDGTLYEYMMPRQIKTDFGKSQYYELLNNIRRGHGRPKMKVKTTKWLEKRF